MAAPKILVLFYSKTGHMLKMARSVAKDAKEAGAEVRLRKASELAPREVIEETPEWKAIYSQMSDIPDAVIDDLVWMDGVIVGTPTRFGNMAAPMRNFWDQTGKLWMEGTLIGKTVSAFASAEMIHGGQEATLLSMYPTFFAHGLIVVGIPGNVKELYKSGSYYGALSSGEPNDTDLTVARYMTQRLIEVTKKLRG
ncbi:MAG: NAD(P)H:quinone oxidoreductase [Nitrospirae bacterium]|nr:NAD(P)H:quinone oxidoreductase [Nitrospirota bacterium]